MRPLGRQLSSNEYTAHQSGTMPHLWDGRPGLWVTAVCFRRYSEARRTQTALGYRDMGGSSTSRLLGSAVYWALKGAP